MPAPPMAAPPPSTLQFLPTSYGSYEGVSCGFGSSGKGCVDEQDAIPASYLATIDTPQPFPDEPIPHDTPSYDPYDVGKNWRVEGGGAAIGGAGIGYAPVGSGGVLFADIMRDRSALINLAIYGSFDLTDFLAFYVD